MQTLNMERFSPAIAEMQAAVEHAKTLTLPDPSDKEQVKKIKEQRLILRSLRTSITKAGKAMREEAVAFQKAVIAKEKDLVALVEPEETRLEALEAEAKRVQDRADRQEFLPRRKERLEALADGIALPTDEELLDMDGVAFEAYFNKRAAEHNERVRQANEARDRELREKEQAQQREKEEAERKQREIAAEKENRKRSRVRRLIGRGYKVTEVGMNPPEIPAGLHGFTVDEIDNDEVEVFEKKFAKVESAIEQHEADQLKAHQERVAAERRAKDEAYQAFLTSHGYNEREFYTVQATDGKITLYKKVGVYDPEVAE